ncbi:MAG: hypothetical protein M3Q95_04825 [Bacteroidota bacterium]|nr:hypothetical protein [Bacteroidota bacterium]
MIVFNKYALLLSAVAMIATSCQTDFDDIKYNNGDANFSRVVAVGGSHLAGYSDRALYLEAQSNSIPAILANRFSFVEGGTFIQPLVKPGIGIGIKGNARYELENIINPCLTGTIVAAQPVAPAGDISNYNWLGSFINYNNLAVPNTRIGDLTNQSYGDPSPFLGNPLYARFASMPGTSTISGDALLLNPSFLVIWMGMEDVYNYARTGGEEGGDSITDPAKFSTKFENLLEEMTSLNAEGVVMNIPGPATIPFFTEVAFNGLHLNVTQAANLNALYAIVDSTITFTAGTNPYIISDPLFPTGRRPIRNGEFILMSVSLDSINCQGWGTTVPIPERYILDADEVADVNAAINAYNAIITTNAAINGLALANMNAFYTTLAKNNLFNGVNYSSEYLYGGAFSTDGFHPSQRGNALLANEIVTTINRVYSSKIPLADVNSYPGIKFP